MKQWADDEEATGCWTRNERPRAVSRVTVMDILLPLVLVGLAVVGLLQPIDSPYDRISPRLWSFMLR